MPFPFKMEVQYLFSFFFSFPVSSAFFFFDKWFVSFFSNIVCNVFSILFYCCAVSELHADNVVISLFSYLFVDDMISR